MSKRRPKNRDNWCIEHWKAYCDILWAVIIKLRAGYRCEICGCTDKQVDSRNGKQMHAHHLIDRDVLVYRHELMNGICLCASCHKLDKHRAAHRNAIVFNNLIFEDGRIFGCWKSERYTWYVSRLHTGPEQDKLKPVLRDYLDIANGLEWAKAKLEKAA